MQGNTHIVGGITASLAFAQITNDNPFVLVGAGVLGALLPDICHGGSKIGRTFPLISKMVNKLFGHRSFTHSLLFVVLVALLLQTIIPYPSIVAGLLIGMSSHIILDMGTKQGVKLFFPFNMSVRFPLTTRTGGKVEKIVFTLLSVLSLYLSYELISRFISEI